ncbi:MAG: hypothetical protein JXQ27_08765, partial [Acidobacteria bacterium]|nr:hypothetical protein [Acidobacteriota bacterium]
MITRQRLCWILAFASLLLGSGVLAIDKIIDRQFPARPGGTFELDSDRGSVAIASGADDHVAVRIRLRARAGSASQADEIFEDFRVHFDETGDGVTMEARCARDGWSLFGSGDNKLNVHFEVEVPARFNLRVKTGGGGISVTDLEGDIQCRTSGG